jgi:hypothetical protein
MSCLSRHGSTTVSPAKPSYRTVANARTVTMSIEDDANSPTMVASAVWRFAKIICLNTIAWSAVRGFTPRLLVLSAVRQLLLTTRDFSDALPSVCESGRAAS